MSAPSPPVPERELSPVPDSHANLIWLCGMRLWPTTGIGFIGLAALALPVDGLISRSCRSWHLRGDIEGTLAVGELFGNGIGVLFVLLTVAALDRQRRVVLRLACSAYLPGLFVSLLKSMITRVRPIYLETNQLHGWLIGFTGPMPPDLPDSGYALQSFPSGHTATAVGLALALTWRYPRAAWLFASMAALTAAERIVHQAHYLSDTLAAVAVALLITGGFVHHNITGWVFDRFENPVASGAAKHEAP